MMHSLKVMAAALLVSAIAIAMMYGAELHLSERQSLSGDSLTMWCMLLGLAVTMLAGIGGLVAGVAAKSKRMALGSLSAGLGASAGLFTGFLVMTWLTST